MNYGIRLENIIPTVAGRYKYFRQFGYTAEQCHRMAQPVPMVAEFNDIDFDLIGEWQPFEYGGEAFELWLAYDYEPREQDEYWGKALRGSDANREYCHDDDVVKVVVGWRGEEFFYEAPSMWDYESRWCWYHSEGYSKNDARLKALESIRDEAERYWEYLNGEDAEQYMMTVKHVASGTEDVMGWLEMVDISDWHRQLNDMCRDVLYRLQRAYIDEVKASGLFKEVG